MSMVVTSPDFRWGLKFFKYLEIAKVNYFTNTTYLANFLSKSIMVVLRIWIFTQLYRVTYATANENEIGGLTVPMVIWGLMIAQSLNTATRPQLSKLIDEEVKSGVIAYSINRPYSYILFHYFGSMGRFVSNLISNLTLGFLAAFILVGPISLSWNGLLLGSLLLFFGYTLDFLIDLMIGLISFWVEDISAFNWIYSKSQLIFGGLILPLSLFPDYLRNIAELLPFSQLFYSGSRLIVNFDFQLFQKYLLIQMAWLVFFWLLVGYVFSKGIKHVSVNGG
ncbi:MAG: hypothetical protein M1150_00655 [Patescibacteria group bacterium]|nr:hypothetical protein [Patescibacteria group bacterium]